MSFIHSPRFDSNTDPYAFLGLTKNPDGSISRLPPLVPDCPPCPESDPSKPAPVLSKDVIINQENNTWARVFLPHMSTSAAKLPLIVYIHGGGFILGSPATKAFHDFCCDLAQEIPALIVSIGYRLVPEHRLPAAYDNAMEALRWIKSSADEWLADHADLSNCFLMGTSAGGNIVYQVGLQIIATVDDLLPLKIRGLILHQPGFYGVERTPSEIRLTNDTVSPKVVKDIVWDLALPAGSNPDHEYCNPITGMKSDVLKMIKDRGWKVMVTGFEGDPLIDRHKAFAGKLKENGIKIVEHFRDGGSHGIEFSDKSKAQILYGVVKDFVLY